MPVKKNYRKAKPKYAIRITGRDASVLSYLARHGTLPVHDEEKLRGQLSPKVAKIVFKVYKDPAARSSIKTLQQLLTISQSNSGANRTKYKVRPVEIEGSEKQAD